jgi:Family of unknown function (DUF6364)
MNLTLSIDDKLLEQAREAARAQGKSVNQMVREYLEQISAAGDLANEIEEFRRTSGTGHRKGWKFNRDELHERT